MKRIDGSFVGFFMGDIIRSIGDLGLYGLDMAKVEMLSRIPHYWSK